MKSCFKDFITDIKDAFNGLPEYLGITIFLSFLFAVIFGIGFGLGCFFALIGVWIILFILFPAIILVLSIFEKK